MREFAGLNTQFRTSEQSAAQRKFSHLAVVFRYVERACMEWRIIGLIQDCPEWFNYLLSTKVLWYLTSFKKNQVITFQSKCQCFLVPLRSERLKKLCISFLSFVHFIFSIITSCRLLNLLLEKRIYLAISSFFTPQLLCRPQKRRPCLLSYT